MSKTSKLQQRLATPPVLRKPNISATPKAATGMFGAAEVAPKNNFWDLAQRSYDVSMAGIQRAHGQLVTYLQKLNATPELKSKIADEHMLASNINLLRRDIASHIQRLNNIYQRHAGKRGSTVSPDDHALVIQINGLYADENEIYESTILPTVGHILEQVGAAEALLELAKKGELKMEQDSAKDVSVVTDVPVKETTTA